MRFAKKREKREKREMKETRGNGKMRGKGEKREKRKEREEGGKKKIRQILTTSKIVQVSQKSGPSATKLNLESFLFLLDPLPFHFLLRPLPPTLLRAC